VLVESVGSEAELEAVARPGLHATRSALVRIDGAEVGVVGEIDPGVLDAFGLSGRVAWLELDLQGLVGGRTGPRQARPVSTFPSSDVDLAFEVADDTPAGAVEATIRAAAAPLLVSLALFDVYRGEGVRAGHRSLAYRLRLQAPDRTLTDGEIGELRQRVIDAVESAHPASLRV
jgi:phenylalanyl-tRNA synthetase beta chain